MKYLIVMVLMLMAATSNSQGAMENSLKEISTSIAQKMLRMGKKRIAVLDLTDISRAETNAGKYIADVISINLLNDTSNFQLYDRQNLDKIMREMKLNSEGYIDEASAKQLGKLLSVDAIVSGNYTVLNNRISITLKVFDSETAFLIGGAMKDISLDDDAKALLGLNASGTRGFNGSVASGENMNNPAVVDKKCATEDFGDYCFQNDSQHEIFLYLDGNQYNKRLNLSAGQTMCFYSLKSGPHHFDYGVPVPNSNPALAPQYTNFKSGEINVQQCRSATLSIK